MADVTVLLDDGSSDVADVTVLLDDGPSVFCWFMLMSVMLC